MKISISDSAKTRIAKMIKEGGKSALLYIKGGGCNGFTYKFKILNTIEKPHKLDEEHDTDEFKLFLCNKSLMYLLGVKIDYIEDNEGSRFNFTNNNIESKCGCGSSFAFKSNVK
jgi:iron-sulfur cluster assembly accessory protein